MFISKIKSSYLLTAIVILGVLLRFWQLGSVPISPDWDEVALGYDAYSFIQTGRDEYGKFLPTILRSFDDYKPALYAYLIIPFIFLFDLSVLAVRLPSAIIGTLTIIAVYFLVKEITKRKDISLMTAFLLAISPWHIQFSRIAFESNVGLGLNIFAALFFIKGITSPKLLMLSTFFAALSLYVYQSEKVFTPILMLVLIIIYHKELFALSKKYLVYAFIIGVITISPLVITMLLDSNTLLRAKGTSIFQDQTVLLQENVKRLDSDHERGDILGLILDNRRIVYAKLIISGYLSHYNLNWLLGGDIARHHAPGMGLLYYFEIPFLLAGIYLLAMGKLNKKTKAVFFAWFLIAPLPASITTGVPHAVRTLNFLPTFQFFTAIGLLAVYAWMQNSKMFTKKYWQFSLQRIFVAGGLLLFLLNFAYYLNQYFVQQNYFHSQDWQYGYEEAVAKVENIGKKYKRIVVSDDAPLDKSYMFFLFYLKYPPAKYQEVGKYSSGGFAEHHAFDKYEFRPIDWEKDKLLQNTLFIGRSKDFPDEIKGAYVIHFLDGEVAMKIVGN